MPKVLIVYYSRTGNTKEMAELIAEGVRRENEVEVEVKAVQDTFFCFFFNHWFPASSFLVRCL